MYQYTCIKEYKCKRGKAHQHDLLCLKWGLSFWLLVIKLVTGQDTTTYAFDKCPKKCIEMSAGSAAEANEPEFKRGYEVDATPDANLDICVFCGICAKACPQDAVTVDRENKTWIVDEDKCIHCAICAYKCPKKCIDMK